jgi:hypothetical protein
VEDLHAPKVQIFHQEKTFQDHLTIGGGRDAAERLWC